MVKITFSKEDMTIQMNGINKILSLKSNITIPLHNIQSVHSIDELRTSDYLNWWTPKLGLSLPNYAAEGTFFEHKKRFFINIHQGKQGIVLKLTDEHYQEIIIEVEDAYTICKELNSLLHKKN